MFKAFIFDFDGVVVDSEYYWDDLSLDTYKQLIPTFDEEFDKQLKGRNAHDIYEMLKEHYGVTFSKEEYFEHLKTITDRVYGELTQPLPGVRTLLKLLKHKHVPIAIASSGERMWINTALNRLGFTDVFDPIVTAMDVGVGKPHPAVYVEAARILNVPVADCVALEDSTNGIRAAKDAGMRCIALRHTQGYAQDLSAADWIVDSLEELTEEKLETLK